MFPCSPEILFKIVSVISVWWGSLCIFLSICSFPFLRAYWFFLELAVLFLPSGIFFIIYIIEYYFTPTLDNGFPKDMSCSKSHQVFRRLLSILADLIDAVVWIVSACLPISTSSSPLHNTPGNRSKRTNCNFFQRLLHSLFFTSLASTEFLSLRFLWFSLSGLLWYQSPKFGMYSFFLVNC